MTSNSRFRQPGNLLRPNQLINSPKQTVAYWAGWFLFQNIDDCLFSGIPINSENERQIMLICRQFFLLIEINDLEIYGRWFPTVSKRYVAADFAMSILVAHNRWPGRRIQLLFSEVFKRCIDKRLMSLILTKSIYFWKSNSAFQNRELFNFCQKNGMPQGYFGVYYLE